MAILSAPSERIADADYLGIMPIRDLASAPSERIADADYLPLRKALRNKDISPANPQGKANIPRTLRDHCVVSSNLIILQRVRKSTG